MTDDDEETYAAAACKGRPLSHFNDWLNGCTSLDENESSYAVGEYIEYLYYQDPQNITAILKCPQSGLYEVWMYELARFIVKMLNFFIASMMKVCNRNCCPNMSVDKSESMQIFCAAHSEPRQCCAIDYCCHALNSLTKTLNDSAHFPSRMSIKQSSINLVKTPFRRLYRIFLHAYCQHTELIEKYQADYSLIDIFSNYLLKLQVLKENDLIIPFRVVACAESSDSSSD